MGPAKRFRLYQCVILFISIAVCATLFLTSRLSSDRTVVFPTGQHAKTTRPDLDLFCPAMSVADDAILMTITGRFAKAADAANITYFMYWGTLIGSCRHHGRIPWDDDVDIIVPSEQKTKLEAMLKTLAPDFLYAKSLYTRWKVFARDSKPLNAVSWKYPFLDVSFYVENDLLLWDEDPGYRRQFTYRKSDVFPLYRRPFGRLMLPAPRNMRAILRQFELEQCVSSCYSHSEEAHIARRKSIPCSELWDRLPFVFRTETNNGTNETLKIGSRVINWFMP